MRSHLRPLAFTLAILGTCVAAQAQDASTTDQGTARAGYHVVALSLPTSPIAAVVLTAPVPALELSPTVRAHITAAAFALGAAVATDVASIGGRVQVRVAPDAVTWSLTAPPERVADLLRAWDARVRRRQQLALAVVAADVFDVGDPGWSDVEAALVFVGEAMALPLNTATPTLDRMHAALGALLIAPAMEVAVVAHEPAPTTRALAVALLAAPTPRPVVSSSPAPPPSSRAGTRLWERAASATATSTSTFVMCPQVAAAPLAVLAQLLGGRVRDGGAEATIEVTQEVARASLAAAAEGGVVTLLFASAQTAADATRLQTARASAKAATLEVLTRPDRVGYFYTKRGSVDVAADALDAVSADDVIAAAKVCAVSGRAVVRSVGTNR